MSWKIAKTVYDISRQLAHRQVHGVFLVPSWPGSPTGTRMIQWPLILPPLHG